MAVSLVCGEVSDLCIGKPALRPLPSTATVGDALLALRSRCDGELCVSVWSADKKTISGRVSVVDVVCYLCSESNIADPARALADPVSVLLPKDSGLVCRLEPNSCILDALDAILEGIQTLVVPIRRRKLSAGGGVEFCWLTQEDLVRHFLNSIAVISSVAARPVASLNVVRSDFVAVRHRDPALSALPLLRRAISTQTSVAVVTDDGKLIGEISPSTLANCDEGVAAALAALSAGDLMAYIDCSPAPPVSAILAVKSKLKEKNLTGMLELLDEEFSQTLVMPLSSSSDEEEDTSTMNRRKPRRMRSGSYSARMGRRSEEAIVCHPESSLVAVMVQALAHRVSYVWVVDEEYTLVGIVTFPDILKVLREQFTDSF
ncbi:CBS domain-containing protein [Dioscorea alata]|uniref:CBS domain-containing protein n=4 Tax=Dioscorea alata TaxID=55571 RepID=A0ACB7UUU1_DIOAL|nr:CBS domain-containing protein [Dioscorea alata]KAH7664385.1 CBS domain-containing protein [Dioscorea alata]KAH7664386.1 CBS domain-containing protein [Dioscorea alata]KAH7664387.1 CBS domain-containing protein [Dioscorea alata]